MTLYARLVIISFLMITLLFVYRWLYPAAGVEKPLISITATPERNVSALFIGSNYISDNNLAKMIVDITSSDLGNHTQIMVKAATQEGAVTLANLSDNRDVQKAIGLQQWDYVIMEGQDEWTMKPDVQPAALKEANDTAFKLADTIRSAGAMPVLYLTWMREPRSSWYTNGETAYFQNPSSMQEGLHDYTSKLASQIQANEVPVGDCWKFVLDNNSALHLYQEDSSRPSPAGTYLAALMFYHFLTGRPIDQVSYLPEGAYAAEGSAIKALLPHCPMY